MKRSKRWIFLALSLGWMALIFWFSAKTGSASSAESAPFAEWLGLPEWIIRKGAHMAEYAVLALLLFGFSGTFSLKGGKKYLVPWLGTAAYGAFDEFHQLFVRGRSGSLKDVGIDGAGAALGLAAIFFIQWICRRLSVRGGRRVREKKRQ